MFKMTVSDHTLVANNDETELDVFIDGENTTRNAEFNGGNEVYVKFLVYWPCFFPLEIEVDFHKELSEKPLKELFYHLLKC